MAKPTFNHNLVRELSVHKVAYFFLILFLSAVIVMFYMAGYDPMWHRISILLLGSGYFIWGVMTHISSKHLTARLVFEYAAISILASVSLIALTV